MRIILSGCLGHMGKAVADAAKKKQIEIAYGVDTSEGTANFPVRRSFDIPPEPGDVIVDFSRPACLRGLLDYACANHVPAVICTTGYSDEEMEQIHDAALKTAVFHSGNMSLGIALLCALSKKAAEVLGEDFDVEIVEAHHNRKADAPSGTAKMLCEAVSSSYDEPHHPQYGRSGTSCRRQHGEIGIHSIRGGTVTGEHQVLFLGSSERITLSHSAEDRSIFASGAIRAAEFLACQPAGFYTMTDVVGNI